MPMTRRGHLPRVPLDLAKTAETAMSLVEVSAVTGGADRVVDCVMAMRSDELQGVLIVTVATLASLISTITELGGGSSADLLRNLTAGYVTALKEEST